jgi:uncharacterized membrane protein
MPMPRTHAHTHTTYVNPVNIEMDTEAPLGARIADKVTGFLGSWRFLVIQTILVIIWIVGNIVLLFHFDPYPFILLNLAFSTQAAYAAPLILLAGNRASQRDRLTLEHAAAEADVEEEQNERLLHGNIEILKRVESMEQNILALEIQIKAAVEQLGRPAQPPA